MNITYSNVAKLQTAHGLFNFIVAKTNSGAQHSILWVGEITKGAPILVRIQSACITSTALGGIVCDCADQVRMAFELIEVENRGVIIYLDDEGRGHGLFEKVEMICEINKGEDTVSACECRGVAPELRTFEFVDAFLNQINCVNEIRLLTNNPIKIRALNVGERNIARTPLIPPSRPETVDYLAVKKLKLGHLLEN